MNLDQLVQATSKPDATGMGNTQVSLSDIANGFLSSIAKTAATGVQNLVDNKTRSQNTQPVPDLSAAAASPAASTYLNASAFGVSLPILVLGIGALAFVLYRR